MKIERLEYWDKSINWGFPPITFDKFNLLVGVSGVGKTKIIESIHNLRQITQGYSFNGVKWDVTFSGDDGTKYRWKGEFETKEFEAKEIFSFTYWPLKEDAHGYSISYEILEINEKIIVERNQDKIRFKGNITPKLSPSQSLVDIFSKEEDIAAIQQQWRKIILSDTKKLFDTTVFHCNDDSITNQNIKYNPNFTEIKNHNWPLLVKLSLVHNRFQKEFSYIKERFSDLFVQVEDIYIDFLPVDSSKTPVIYIKEQGSEHWIYQDNLSSGMRKTLNFICELYLSPPGSVMIIDEFENSLGVNCIDIIAEDFLGEERDFQFIITSHHPYIINNIPGAYWKIVTRKGGVVTVKDARDLKLGKSKHEAFMQLINNENFSEGIAVE